MPRTSRVTTHSHCALVCISALMLLPARGFAQLTPDREYYGVQRAVPMHVAVPEKKPTNPPATKPDSDAPSSTANKAESLHIDLFSPTSDTPVATAPVLAGPVDMAALFPILWKSEKPKVLYAQLVVGQEQVGPPVLLVPMLTAPMAKFVQPASRQVYFRDPANKDAENFSPRDGEIVWTMEPPAYSGVRAWVDEHVIFETDLGEVEFRLRPDVAPATCATFASLVRGGFYTDILFHRIVPTRADGTPFVVQVGDPTGSGDGGPGFSIDLEQSTLPYDFGVLGMARSTDPDTNGSQVFIALSREGTKKLDGKYTSFAQAVRGEATILALSRVEVKDEKPVTPVKLRRATLAPAPPFGARPKAVQRPAEKPVGR